MIMDPFVDPTIAMLIVDEWDLVNCVVERRLEYLVLVSQLRTPRFALFSMLVPGSGSYGAEKDAPQAGC